MSGGDAKRIARPERAHRPSPSRGRIANHGNNGAGDEHEHEHDHVNDIDEREATELRGFDALVAAPLDRLIPRVKAAAEQRPVLGQVERFWRRHVAVSVPHATCRDHLGKWKWTTDGSPADATRCEQLSSATFCRTSAPHWRSGTSE